MERETEKLAVKILTYTAPFLAAKLLAWGVWVTMELLALRGEMSGVRDDVRLLLFKNGLTINQPAFGTKPKPKLAEMGLGIAPLFKEKLNAPSLPTAAVNRGSKNH